VLRHSSGSSTLTVTASDQDVVITLVQSGSTTATASMYVRSGATAELTGIPAKTFQIYEASGTDWDASNRQFTRACSFGVTADPADFNNADYSLTLKSPLGNTKTNTVAPGQYPSP
jgi:hypothetical protein